ncbi:MAG: 3-deoxy-manno-octulosonate cytidylyltransferase [Methylacidiphilales bacterium]|nr:3-deoxy-manno-octulosonate cytidylyltransferase [Candidatus Methylacidiphilales bacterium]MDW8348995.1 3-deoxy-manno-octulosonate cytidylyltransferase [Verrucomicrobiae bacterium]
MKTDSVVIVIPARYGSTRFPGKPLASILGKPMIQWVWESVIENQHGARVIVATDDERIKRVVEGFGGEVVMTSSLHATGTDRMAEVARTIDAEWWLNVQGDEPLIEAREVDNLIEFLVAGKWDMVTLAHPIESEEEWRNRDVVKVIFRDDGQAVYFSRSEIPYAKSWPVPAGKVWRHVGLYGYRREALERFVNTPQQAWEICEGLEQLRAVALGMRIGVMGVTFHACGVDREEDLVRVERVLQERRRV